MKYLLLFFIVISLTPLTQADNFSQLWYDGTAEISTYRLKEMRYGQERVGTRVMVFVTEPMRLTTHIKPDVSLPQEQKISVIKLNDIRKFSTGIYDYSVMSSVFAAVEKKPAIELGATMKLSFTCQEWCGTVFEQVLRQDKKYQGYINSYFESEGKGKYQVSAEEVETEDNLWLLVRELQGPILKEGESQKIRLLPSMWLRRKWHQKAEIQIATLSKKKSSLMRTALGAKEVSLFTWEFPHRKTEVWVEKAYPHRILGWKEGKSSEGFILASSRETYWQQSANKFSYLRDKLELD